MTLPIAVHILPYDGIGGAEIAARTVQDGRYGGFEFVKFYLTMKDPWGRPEGMGRSENNPLVYLSALRAMVRARPAVLVASLWRSYLVLIATKMLRPGTRAVTFLHSAVDMHIVDRFLSRLAMLLSAEIWADSRATIEGRVPARLLGRARVISFLTERQPAVTPASAPGPRFIFWGRLHWQKDVPRAVRLFARVQADHPAATFEIIGPDGGAKRDIEAQIEALGVRGVTLHGSKSRDEIFKMAREQSLYLQTSAEEGAAMSVMEAMQLGLVPVVTPVGEIGSYCVDGENAVVVRDDEAAAARVTELLQRPDDLQRMSALARATWLERPLYREDVLAACAELLGFQASGSACSSESGTIPWSPSS